MGWRWVIDDAGIHDAINNVSVGVNGQNSLVKIAASEEKRGCNCCHLT